MHWTSWNDFWSMGGSGNFVWGAYGLAAFVMAVEVAMVCNRARRARRNLVIAETASELPRE
jgi:heme exporter protein CcmD